MCGGAFEGITDVIERRAFKDRRSLGFRSGAINPNGHGPVEDEDILDATSRQTTYLEYGFIPEFVGRFPVVVSLAGTRPRHAGARTHRAEGRPGESSTRPYSRWTAWNW